MSDSICPYKAGDEVEILVSHGDDKYQWYAATVARVDEGYGCWVVTCSNGLLMDNEYPELIRLVRPAGTVGVV